MRSDKVTLLDCPLGAWGDKVPQDVQDAVAEAKAKLDGGASVYAGPLTDNKGTERVAAGKSLDALGAYGVNFAVEGVSGV